MTSELNAMIPESKVNVMGEKEIRRRFGCYLRYAREQKRLTGSELGRRLNVSQQQISRYERGITTVNLLMMSKIVHVLDLRWDELIHQIIHAESPPWL
ncbi:TPA: helix-turn-helix domain-containing protein [Providencia alcalifaciens]|uniref:helix-turn-helix domain-containing protein n=1 Tax=Providencia sp. JUb39 TaxID=2724165 RepID=UPI00164EBF21|nr:helix-turn-helix transcriptional regulator [Providencia sp. JUb39]MBC5792349.1 helix-turn-helix transcriptional regulator [Providencia sp. JUb39]